MAWTLNTRNVRYPHTCTIVRRTDVSSFDDNAVDETIYEGECRLYSNTSIRTFTKKGEGGQVSNEDMQISLPIKRGDGIAIHIGDLVTVTTENFTIEEAEVIGNPTTNIFGTFIGISHTKN